MEHWSGLFKGVGCISFILVVFLASKNKLYKGEVPIGNQ